LEAVTSPNVQNNNVRMRGLKQRQGFISGRSHTNDRNIVAAAQAARQSFTVEPNVCDR
jgi:hypothetical protein